MTQAPQSRWWRWRPGFRRDLLAAAIERGADAGGCAICWVLAERERRSLWILLRENVLDPGIRRDWNRTLGFCARHTSALCATATRMGQVPGAAILFGDTAREVARRIEAGAPLHVWRDCVECRREAQSESAHVRRLNQQLGDPDWTQRWAPSLRLCVRHAASTSMAGGRAGLTMSFADHLRELAAGPGGTHGAQGKLPALQAALLGFESLSGIPALPRWGCGTCDAETVAVTSEGRSLFQEGATPPGSICRRHASLLLASSAVTPAQLAAHYRLALKQAADALEQRARSRRGAKGPAGLPAACPLCVFVDARDREPAGRVEPGGPEAALCLRHMEAALGRPASAGDGGTASRAAHVEALRALARELGELHRKSSWDARNEPRGEEQTSWIRAGHYLTYDQAQSP